MHRNPELFEKLIDKLFNHITSNALPRLSNKKIDIVVSLTSRPIFKRIRKILQAEGLTIVCFKLYCQCYC